MGEITVRLPDGDLTVAKVREAVAIARAEALVAERQRRLRLLAAELGFAVRLTDDAARDRVRKLAEQILEIVRQ